MSTADISTLQVKVTSEGVVDTTKALNNLAKSADKAEQATKKLGTQVLNSNASMAASAGASVALTNAILSLNTTLTNVGGTLNRNTSDIRSNTKAMRDAHDAARGLAGSLGALWVTYGNLAPMAAGLAIGASLKGIVTVGKDVEHAIEAMRVKGNETVESANALRDSIMSIGQGVYGPREVAQALDALILAGLSAKEAMAGVKASLNLATAGGSSIEQAAESLVTIGTAVGATSEQYDHLADGISKAANTSLASVQSIAETVKRASVVNKLYGATFEDILVQASALSQLGIKNTSAGTAITNFYSDAMGKSEKAKKALSELKFSFFDAAGAAKPLVQAMTEFDKALKGFTEKDQVRLIQDIFGERGMRDVVALQRGMLNSAAKDSDTYKNALEELEAQIKNMAGTSALAAAQLALTTENQFKSVGNTLEVAFAKIFLDLEPQMNVVAMQLKKVFNSQDFQTAVGNVAKVFASLAVSIADNIGPLVAVAEGILAFKLISAALAMTTGVSSWLAAVGTGLGAVTVASTGAVTAVTALGTAMRFLMLSLPVIGVLLGVVAAAVALYNIHSAKAKDNTNQIAEAYNTNYLQALKDEADRLEKTNKLMNEGATAAQANAAATRELALAKAQANNQDAVEAARKRMNDAQTQYDNLGPTGNPFARAKAAEQRNAAAKDMDAAIDAASRFNWDAKEAADRVIAASEAQRQAYKAEQDRTKAELAGQAGDKTVAVVDKAMDARRRFYEGEQSQLEQLIATYKARTEAVLAGAAAEERVMAKVERKRIEAAGPSKYPSMGAYNAQLALADKADQGKFEQQNANAIVEQQNKITAILERKRVHVESINSLENEHVSTLEKQTSNVMKFNHASEETLKIERARAKEAGEWQRIEDAHKKLESSTTGSQQRAAGYIEEADSIAKFGNSAKATAVDAAKVQIELMKLDATFSGQQINARLNGAAMEDLGRSYRELAKQYETLMTKESENAAVGAEGVIGAETAKVKAIHDTTIKALEFDKQRAASALALAQSTKNPAAIRAAQDTFDKVTGMADKVRKALEKDFTLKFEVAGLRDIGDMVGQMSDAASGMGKSFAGAAEALSGVSSAFQTLADIKAAEGINDEERNARQIGAYGDMASASASFFSENSRGYQTMMGISKVFHAAEMAMTMWRLGKLAIEAVMTQAKGDPYTAWGRMAAMAAVVGTLGFAVGGGFNGGSGGKTAEDVQKKQGTGTVFGDAEAKSNTISKSMEMLKSNSDFMLPLTEAMKNSLSSIEASMTGLSNLVLRSNGVQSGKNFDIATGVIGKSLGGLWGKTKQNIVDAGIAIKGSVAGLQAGQGYNQYASVDTTKSSFFGLKKKTTNKVETQGLDSELSSQFALIFTKLEDSLALVGPTFGKTADQVSSAIDNLAIDASVSLKDLKGEDLEAALNGVISKAMDQIAETAFPAMGAFRQVGEGYAQTVIRVASGIEQSSVALEAFGIKSISFSEMANKTGDVAFELTKQSIGLYEAGSGVGKLIETFTGSISDLTKSYQQLVDIRKLMTEVGLGANLNAATIKGAGGSDKLNTALEAYYDKFFEDDEKIRIETAKMTGLFSKLGMALPDSREQLRTWVETAASTGDQLQVGQLLALAGGFDELATMIEKIGKAAEEAAAKIDPYQNEYFLSEYFTAFERIGIETTKVTKGFGELNLAMPGSRDELRKWVLAAHEAGDDKTVGKLLALTETFGGLLKMIDDFKVNPLKDSSYLSAYYSAVEQVSIMTQHMTEDFGKLGYALPDSRAQLRAWMDAAVAAGDQTTVNKLLELSAAFTTLTDTVMDVKLSDIEDLEKTAKDAMDDAESAFNTVKRMIDKEKKLVNETITSAKDSISGLKTVLEAIDEAIKSTAPSVTKAEQFADAMQTVNDALLKVRGGAKLQDIKGLDDAYASLGSDDSSEYSTLFDFQRDQAYANALLKDLQEAGKGQLTEAEKVLAAAEMQLKVLETQLETAEGQLNALKGIDESVMSVEAALGKFADAVLKAVAANAALAAGKTDGGVSAQVESLYKNLLGRDSDAEGKKFWVDAVNGGQSLGNVAQGFTGSDEYKAKGVTSQLESLYNGLLGRQSDAAGLKYWTDAYNSGTSISQITKDFLDSEEYKKKSKIPSFAIGTNEVPEDMLANIHKGERIIPAADNAELMRRLDEDGNPKTSDTGNNAQFEELKQIIQSGDIAKVQKIAELFKIIREWDNTGIPGERITEE